MEIVDPYMAMVVGQSSETGRRINCARSIDASSKEKLIAFFGRKVARCFDGDVDLTGPVGYAGAARGDQHSCKAVSNGDFGDGDRTVRSTGVKICCTGGAYERAEHYLPMGSVGLGFLIIRNIEGSGVGGGWREDVGVVPWSIGSIVCG